jgi:hypothetical protein
VTVVDRAPVLIAEKQVSTGDYVSLNVSSTGGPLREGEDLIVSTSLPPGVRFASLSQTCPELRGRTVVLGAGDRIRLRHRQLHRLPGLDVDIRSNLTVETIDDFAAPAASS